VFGLPVTEPRDDIGIVFQKPTLLPWASVEDNVLFPIRHKRGRVSAEDRARTEDLLHMVGLDGFANRLPDELSGGERQRVAVARALSGSPPILLADEPTGNLDTSTGRDILALLHDLHARLNVTIVMVTHDMDVAASCERTLTIRDGGIVSDVRRPTA
jgi:NitT/TauT family transport system ATP-binding protein